MSAALDYLGDELRRARESVDMTQEELAKALHCSRSLVAMWETGKRAPDPEAARRMDELLGTNGYLGRMRDRLVVAESNPGWFVPWIHYEQEAGELSLYEPLLVPGLLQTPEYAKALLGSDDRAQARLRRQAVLDRAQVTVVIEESVLHRQISSRDVMLSQLTALAEASACVQVIPSGTTEYLAYESGFAVAAVDGAEICYLDTALRGFVVDEPGVISEARRRWLTLRAEALPQRHSRDLIMKVAREVWKG